MRKSWCAVIAVVIVSLFTATTALADNLVVNGGFETGDFTGWTLTGGGCVGAIGSAPPPGCSGVDADPGPHSGTFAAYLGPNGQTDTLSQSLATNPGQTYEVDFFLANTSLAGATTPNTFTAAFGDPLLNLTDAGAFGYTEYQYWVTATGTSTDLSFSFRQDPAYWVLDDVSVSAVPEPSSLLLLGGGSLALLGPIRKKLLG